MAEFQGYLELDRTWQHDLLYTLIFREYIYTFVLDHGLNRNKSNLLENVEGFEVVVEIPFSLRLISFSRGQIPPFKLFLRCTNTLPHSSGNLSSNPSLLGKSILASKDMPLLMNKWKFYLVHLWQCHFYVWSQGGSISINQLSKNAFGFLGYLSSMRINLSVVQSQMLQNSFLMDNAMKKIDTLILIGPLIGSLAKIKFCNVVGQPLSKSTCTDLSDFDIIDRFARICINLFHSYSRASKKKSLYRVKYILRLSCVKTLARKHKSTVCTFLKRLGSELLDEFFTEEEEVLSLIFPRTYSTLRRLYKGLIWYLDIFCINDLVNYE
ncbi:hypothetical protein G4B88_010194 [Cannabis sativa]|uniref:Maturase K n=1 Tax=Cannabis sativa TaxID=3483 RepID=A0A7J6I572_CANSA|nr:hypothetical protein G4B88_010194 [Cannabis sativa]